MEFKKYTKVLTVNGHAVETVITVTVEEDDQSILMDQDFETPKQREAYASKVESGSIFCGHVAVTATALGLEGHDSIGGCELKPNNMFNSDPFEKSVNSVLKEYSLEQNAIDSLVTQLQDECTVLTRRAKAFAHLSREANQDTLAKSCTATKINAKLLAAVKSMLLYIETYGGAVTEHFGGENSGNYEYYKDLIKRAERK
jgi:hypothetical protein